MSLWFGLQADISKIRTSANEDCVLIKQDTFFNILRQMLQHVQVDEDWYLERHQDVRQAVARGAFGSAKDHFVKHGYLEGKLPYAIPVDQAYYLETNADVRAAVEAGAVASARRHFLQQGYKEGRLPCPGFSLFKPADDLNSSAGA